MTETMTQTRTLHVERSTSTAHRLSHYEGVCGNIHGHNFKWEVEVEVSFDPDDEAAMPLDLKDVSDAIDQVDHACLLNKSDPIMADVGGLVSQPLVEDLFGDVVWFDQDPTCEIVAAWMAEQIYQLTTDVVDVDVFVYETDKYGVSHSYEGDGLEQFVTQAEGGQL